MEELTEEQGVMIEGASCFDPETASIEGTKVHSDFFSQFKADFSE